MFTILKLYIAIHFVSFNTPPQTLNEQEQKILTLHNQARKEVGVAPLQWSEELATLAQEWADHLAQKGVMMHRPIKGKYGSETGENISWTSEKEKLSDGFDMWYEEKKYYNARTGRCSGKTCGHYTQIVWKKTTAVGCGCAHTKSGGTIVVCNYSPSGNWSGEKAY